MLGVRGGDDASCCRLGVMRSLFDGKLLRDGGPLGGLGRLRGRPVLGSRSERLHELRDGPVPGEFGSVCLRDVHRGELLRRVGPGGGVGSLRRRKLLGRGSDRMLGLLRGVIQHGSGPVDLHLVLGGQVLKLGGPIDLLLVLGRPLLSDLIDSVLGLLGGPVLGVGGRDSMRGLRGGSVSG